MRKDIEITKVKFVKFKGEIVALFPECVNRHNKNMIMSYAHLGQHSEASRSLLKCKKATLKECADLLNELTKIGYNLEVQS